MHAFNRRATAVGAAALLLAGAAVAAVPGSASAANILTNPGFESGTLSGWSCSGGTGSVVSTPVHGGSKALAGAVTAGDTARCAQTVAVQPSTTYTLSSWVRGNYVYLGVTGAGSTWTPSASDWKQLSVTFTTGAAQTSAEVYLNGWFGQGTYYADDVSLDGPGGGPVDTQPPTAPTGLVATATAATQVSLSWGASSDNVGVTGYDVYRNGTPATTVTGTSATVTGLTASTAYTFTVKAHDAAGNVSAASNSLAVTTPSTGGGTPGGFKQAAPYLYNGWGNPPSPTTVMNASGIKWFTLAFVLAQNGCNPTWDSQRPLLNGVDQQTINAVRAAGGDVVPSFGGWSGNKLGPACADATALAGAYQKVIDAYQLKAIDIDIENTDEFENYTVQDRILGALKIVKQKNPGIRTIVTFGTATSGPTAPGNRLIEQSKALGVDIDVFTIMPFDFGNASTDMYAATVSAANGLKNKLKSVYGWDDATAYSHLGISGMNGLSDNNETTSIANWTAIRDWSNTNHIARLAFWSVNRDRGCPGGGLQETCSGIAQSDWQFSTITAGFTG
ncbi:carbohydrate binding domain-containing protein [Kitasatospora sp. CB01950]|uniref:carbohydrate binding domain-containing protein n=1 Tax=Kitasatospora sp. CB01950 TaxID=1703930 RepID=UPI00093AF437|nr:carbohydrate binding domain-containing protein [Kitasatospora sp. CB01950]OKJ05649.1 chitinase [Kitasatospora sp. CB01950]